MPWYLISFYILLIFVIRMIVLLVYSHPLFRTYFRRKSFDKKRKNGNRVKTVIVLGSGGHTTEILLVVSRLDPMKYSRYYVIASTDKRSYDKVVQSDPSSNYNVCYIPRSREVHQSFFTSIFSTLHAFLDCIPIILRIRPELVLCNGPGTCVPICLATFLLKVLFLSNAKIIFIESICRVKTISLTAKILRYFVDEFVVQWPELNSKYPDSRYIGRL